MSKLKIFGHAKIRLLSKPEEFPSKNKKLKFLEAIPIALAIICVSSGLRTSKPSKDELALPKINNRNVNTKNILFKTIN
jgi:hypothetical protein